MKFLDGFLGTAGVFFERKATLNDVNGMYELAVQQWGARESAKFDRDSLQQLIGLIREADGLMRSLQLQVQQEFGVLNLNVPYWAVHQLHHDITRGDVHIPHLHQR